MIVKKWFWFPVAVVATSVALVVALGAFLLFPVRIALASGLGIGGAAMYGPLAAGPWGHGQGFTLPPQLQGLVDVPADQKFSHFVGVQVSLKDKDNNPLLVSVTPGTVSAAAPASVTIAANDGTSKTFAIDGQTMVHGKSGASQPSGSSTPLTNGDKVFVVTLNNSATATAVIGGDHDFGPTGPGGSWGSFHHGR
jgi:hypothetical protein